MAAKALPDLQTPGRDGTTLLCVAVTQSWQRPELAEAVRTLLSLGADPNYTNGKRGSFAMANAVHASAPIRIVPGPTEWRLEDVNGTPGAFRTNPQTASGRVRRALGLGRETRDGAASALELTDVVDLFSQRRFVSEKRSSKRERLMPPRP